ncbi:MAG: hypothetical protein ACOC2M_03195, partial [bacterium]
AVILHFFLMFFNFCHVLSRQAQNLFGLSLKTGVEDWRLPVDLTTLYIRTIRAWILLISNNWLVNTW